MAKDIREKGEKVFLRKDSLVILFAKRGKHGFIIPKSIEDILKEESGCLMVSGYEKGGFEGRNGMAEIITNEQGNELAPFSAMGTLYPNGTHAELVSQTNLVRIRARVGRGRKNEYTITAFSIRPDEGMVYLEKEEIYRGDLPGGKSIRLPEDLKCYQDALDAAVGKAICRNCVHTHFVA